MPDQEVVLITGTRTGIGRFLAEHFVSRGALVEGCSRNPPDWSLEGYTHHCLDVADEGAVRAMFVDIQKRHGRLDVLINNAGIASMNHILLTPLATLEKIMATNLYGTFLMCREAVKLMQRHRYGRIVNLSTVAVNMRLEGEAAYAASKSAVVTFSQILAKEVAPFGITCNVVAPTPIETDLIRHVPEEKIRRIVESQAIKRAGTFEDVANVVDFFVKKESSFITGQVITLGGIL
ncbi:dehydrogenase related to short-chain alcohol dehydrogenases [Anaerolinea thermolimosa]|uniref:Dehydrogenase related to short-chain alcohol dehydrogenases n=1 Tax=Anaerolinea thermolimosa TaxID=229919 RepID=A0A7U9PXC0_9CHLR|nr:SDR family oxidoreductase [Anaerolinea thermolimosa]GAP08614.1 dehydrogenase related to short-chain alcohol dehydrogenases [Anaerolinea thermolimosa]